MPEQGGGSAGRSVIGNTSPLLYLHRIDRLQLLRCLYGTILLPDAVIRELELGGVWQDGISGEKWIMRSPCRGGLSSTIMPDLGGGETEVITLALEHGVSSLAILDDGLARRIAALHSIKVTGTAGVLLRAKECRLIDRITPELERLVAHGFYLKPDHFKAILRIANED